MHDQYLSFIALEGRLFSLGLPNSYLQLNDPKAQDTQIQVRMLCWHCILRKRQVSSKDPEGTSEGVSLCSALPSSVPHPCNALSAKLCLEYQRAKK